MKYPTVRYRNELARLKNMHKPDKHLVHRFIRMLNATQEDFLLALGLIKVALYKQNPLTYLIILYEFYQVSTWEDRDRIVISLINHIKSRFNIWI